MTESGCGSRVGSTSVAFQHSFATWHVTLQAAHDLCQRPLPIAAANVFFPWMIPLYSPQHLGDILDHTHT